MSRNFIEQDDILYEIHQSKKSYCWFADKLAEDYDMYVSLDDLRNQSKIRNLVLDAKKERAIRLIRWAAVKTRQTSNVGRGRKKLANEVQNKVRTINGYYKVDRAIEDILEHADHTTKQDIVNNILEVRGELRSGHQSDGMKSVSEIANLILDKSYLSATIELQKLLDTTVRSSYSRYDYNDMMKCVENVSYDDVIFRVNDDSYIPRDSKGKMPTLMLPAFKHYRLQKVFNEWHPVEVGRALWKGDLETGEFCQTHGRNTNKLSAYHMQMVDNFYRKSNMAGYTWNDDLKGDALVNLTYRGLKYDESYGTSVFSFYTQYMVFVFNGKWRTEDNQRKIKDEFRMNIGLDPSFKAQVDNEVELRMIEEIERKEDNVMKHYKPLIDIDDDGEMVHD